MPKKRKKSALTKKKEELWLYFSTFIKHRDKQRCFTCGVFTHSRNSHAGHFIPSSVGGVGLRYDETNVHNQCMPCNLHKSGNWPAYRENMIALYGEEHVKALEARRHEITPNFDYEAKTEEYKKKCQALGLVQGTHQK